MPTYNMTALQESTTIIDLVTSANSFTGDILFPMLILIVFAVVFLSLTSKYGMTNATITASFLTTLVSVFLTNAGLLNIWVTLASLAVLVIMIFVKLLSKNRAG